MAALAIRLQFEPLRSVAYTSISGTYLGVGTALVNPASQIWVVNDTNALLKFSFDGVTDHFVLPPSGFFLSDIGSNRSIAQAFYIAAGERLYVAEIGTPTLGSVYFTSMYGAGAGN